MDRPPRYMVVVSEVDPVASALAARWGTLPSTGATVDGAAVRVFPSGALYLRRPIAHIHDEHLDARLPSEMRRARPTLVFPSIHRSAQNVRSLTVHPLGNPGASAEVGGRPRTLVPTDPTLMSGALRALAERAGTGSTPVTFEATHHGPELGLPSFFVEIGFGELASPPPEELDVLERVVPNLEPSTDDTVALAAGGGHYAPHFTDLVRKRRWSFGHILSRHALAGIDPAVARSALELTPGAQGVVYAKASEPGLDALRALAPRLREAQAAARIV